MNQLRVPKELLSSSSVVVNDDDDENNENNEKLKVKKKKENDEIFQHYLKDAKTLEEIRKDVVRTHPSLQFYLETKRNVGIRRHAAVERILFVWAKLNGNLYVQVRLHNLFSVNESC